MADLRKRIAVQMSALIDGPAFGCGASAIEAIYASTGLRVSEGTLTKRKQGMLGWPVDEVAALERASGCYPITKLLSQRVTPQEAPPAGSMISHAGRISKEAGEAVNAILAAQQSDCAEDHAQAEVEILEAIEAMQRALGVVRAK